MRLRRLQLLPIKHPESAQPKQDGATNWVGADGVGTYSEHCLLGMCCLHLRTEQAPT